MEKLIYSGLDGLLVYTKQAAFILSHANSCYDDGEWIIVKGRTPESQGQEIEQCRYARRNVIGLSRKLRSPQMGSDISEVLQ